MTDTTAKPTTTASSVEPWLSGSRTETKAVGRAVLHALDLAMEDIEKWTEGFTPEQLSAEPHGQPSLAFHLRHIARSTDRILTYAEGGELSAEQLGALKAEKLASPVSRAELLEELCAAFTHAEQRIRELSIQDFDTPRTVGRKQLPTTLGGALIHVADHTQRHVGQVVTTAKLVKALTRK